MSNLNNTKQGIKVTTCNTPLVGEIVTPPDKSISHRAVLFNSVAIGTAKITNLLEGEDVISTITALRQCGVEIDKQDDGSYIVKGVGLNGLQKPQREIYFGNSGTSTRLFMGLIASYDFDVRISGDESLSKRPMLRVTEPLSQMGVRFFPEDAKTLPISMQGSNNLMPIDYKLKVASAQVKSAILLAGLNTRGTTTVVEPEKTRDHTEIMLKNMGADVRVYDSENKIEITGLNQIKATDCIIPADPSSAAFIIAAGVLIKGSNLLIKNLCTNPTRIGFIKVLQNMGADVAIVNQRTQSAEMVGDVIVKYSPNLKPAFTTAKDVPAMVDEFLILSVICAFANGTSELNDLHELTTKESNRFDAIVKNLSLCGVSVEADYEKCNLKIKGMGGNFTFNSPKEPIATRLDHRIAMSFLIAGLRSQYGIEIDDASPIATSFPNFITILKSLGVVFE